MKQFDRRGVINSRLSFTFPETLFPSLNSYHSLCRCKGPFGYKCEYPNGPYIFNQNGSSSDTAVNRHVSPTSSLFVPQDARPSQQKAHLARGCCISLPRCLLNFPPQLQLLLPKLAAAFINRSFSSLRFISVPPNSSSTASLFYCIYLPLSHTDREERSHGSFNGVRCHVPPAGPYRRLQGGVLQHQGRRRAQALVRVCDKCRFGGRHHGERAG